MDTPLDWDAIDLVVAERPGVVVIASSDSDFAPLVQRLREKGCVVRGIGQQGRHLTQLCRDGPGLGQPGADGGQVTRAAPIQRKAGQRAVHVRHAAQIGAQVFTKAALIQQKSHRRSRWPHWPTWTHRP